MSITSMTPTTATPTLHDTMPPPTDGAGLFVATAQTARRTVLQFFRTPQVLLMGTIQGALFLFVFRYIFGGAIDTGTAFDYVDFLVPGFLATGVLWTLMPAAPGIAEDAASGVHDRLRSLPIPRSAVVAGRSLADTALTSWGLIATAALGIAVGFRTHAPVADVLAACGLLFVAAFAFSWMFQCLGLYSGNAQSAQGATLIVVPLTFVSSAYVPQDSLPGWMQPVADHQPVTVLSNAMRSLMLGGSDTVAIGHSTAYWVALSLAWCAGITIAFAGLAVRRFGRTR